MRTSESEAISDLLLAARVALADVRWALLERKYRPDQARAPAGSSDGGRWVDEHGGGAPGLTTPSDQNAPVLEEIAQRTAGVPTIDLRAEEASGSSHAIAKHVAQSNAQLRAAIIAQDPPWPVSSVFVSGDPQGSFDSIGSANTFANAALQQQSAMVQDVIAGKYGDINVLVEARLGVVTGREAYRLPGDDQETVRFRSTFGVGVVIRRAPNGRGFAVRTAFPQNDKPDRM